MSAQVDLGFGTTNWTCGAARAMKIKAEYSDATKRLRKIERSIATEERAIEFARRNPGNHRAAQSSRSAEARLVDHRRDQAAVVDQMLALTREVRAL
jgi:hypothetical protein